MPIVLLSNNSEVSIHSPLKCSLDLLVGISLTGQNELYSSIWVVPYTFISPAPLSFIVPLYGLMIGLTCAIAASPAGIKVFGEEKTVYWREAASGHSKLAYYFGKLLSSLPRIAVSSLHFAAIYQVLARPIIPFAIQYTLILAQFYGVYGVSAIISLIVRRENASLVAVIVSMVIAILNGYGPKMKNAHSWGIEFLWEMSYNKWASEAACMFLMVVSNL